MSEYLVIGKGLPRKDSILQATGQAEFVQDMTLPRMLFGKTLKSPYAHARIVNINTSKAERLPGVKAVITGRDTPGLKYGPLKNYRDRDLLAIDKVRFIGDEVATVAAIDEDIAEEALELIKVEYEPLPPVLDAAEAMQQEGPRVHDAVEHNIALERHWNFGDVEKGFKKADYVREDRLTTQITKHGYLETHACLADYDSSGKLTVWANSQRLFSIRRDLSRTLGIPYNKIRVIKPHVGGAFGGKEFLSSPWYCASLLAMKTGQPVKMVYTMREDMMCTYRRMPMIYNIKTGVKKDGTLVAQHTRAILDGGAFIVLGPSTLYNIGLAHMIPYRLPNFKLDAYQIYTNKMPHAPQRGHGQVQTHFAIEYQLDMIAEELGLDPAEVRLKNALHTGDVTVNGLRIISSGFSEAIQKATEGTGWKEKRSKPLSNRGIGIGCSGFPCGAREAAQSDTGAVIHLTEEGDVILLMGVSDVGQGCNTIMTQIVAEILGLAVEDITIFTADTETTPFDPGAWASRTTFYAGNAAKRAAEDVRDQLARVAAARLGVTPEDLEFRDKAVSVKGSPERRMSFADAVREAQTSSTGKLVIGTGSYFPPNVEWPDRKTYAGNITGSYSFATQVAEVEVDKETGQVRVVKLTTVGDSGRVLNPLLWEGQVEGGGSMAQGMALYEELHIKDGQVMNPSFMDYRMPTALDAPQMESISIVSNEPEGPFGAKEVGEGIICCSVGAIANAIHNATGVWVKDLPITPEKILKALREKGRS